MSLTIDVPRNTRAAGPYTHRPNDSDASGWQRLNRGSRHRRRLLADTVSLTRAPNHRHTDELPTRPLPRHHNTVPVRPSLVIPAAMQAGLKNARTTLATTRPEHIAIMMVDGDFGHFSTEQWQRALQSMDLPQPNPIYSAMDRLHLAEFPEQTTDSLLGLIWLRAAHNRDKNLQDALITTIRESLHDTWRHQPECDPDTRPEP